MLIFQKIHIQNFIYLAYFTPFYHIYLMVMKMKRKKTYILTGIIFVSILGTFLHFAYNLSGNNFLVGLFTPINESVWEHTKLIFFPMLLYGLFLNGKQKDTYPDIYTATILGSVVGVLFTIISFYTYSGIIGYNLAFVDISIFYISVILAFYVTYKSALSPKLCKWDIPLTFLGVLMIALYIIFTLYPPDIPLFVSL